MEPRTVYTLERLFEEVEEGVVQQEIGVAPGGLLTVMPGDKVRVTAQVDYMGGAINDVFYVAIGQRHPIIGFDEWWVAQVPISLAASTTWKTYTLTADVQIPSTEKNTNLCDVYCKIKGHLEAGLPEYDGVIQVVGAPSFQNFKITDYSKV